MKIKRILKGILIKLKGNKKHLKKGIKLNFKWYGHRHGSLGFNVCPTMLNKDSIVYSFGIGEDVSFDESIIERHGCKVFGFDPTPRSVEWVNKRDTPDEFHFLDYGIGEKTEMVDFFLPKNQDHISGSIAAHNHLKSEDYIKVQMKSLKDISSELKHPKINLLKLDIEGGEYAVLPSILNSGVIIDQFLIEFHEHFFDNGKDKTVLSLESLREKGYEIFAISDSYNEISFVRKSLV